MKELIKNFEEFAYIVGKQQSYSLYIKHEEKFFNISYKQILKKSLAEVMSNVLEKQLYYIINN